MDPLSFFLNQEGNEVEQVEQKEKKKKKLSPAALKKLQAKAAEEARQQLIKQKQNYLAETKRRVQSEWEANHNKAAVYEAEFLEREKLLLLSSQKLADIEGTCRTYREYQRIQEEWTRYTTCDRLPDPSSVSQMNSYLFVWTELDRSNQMSHCMRKAEEVMELLSGLEKIIRDPGPGRPASFVRDMKELRSEIRNLLQDHIDRATFHLFSRIDTDMTPINVTTSKYFAKCQHFLMSFWAELITPIPSSRKKEVRFPLKVTFEEVDVTVVVPVSLLGIHKVMRAMWLHYDHWSDRCRTFDCPPLPSYYDQNLYDLFLVEHEMKKEIMHYREQLELLTKKKISAIPAEPTLSQELLAWDSEPQKALSDEIISRECAEEESMGRQVKSILSEFEVNLRQRTFLGSLLLLEIFHQPPQPKVLRYKHSVTLRREPPKLRPTEFYVKFPPPEEGTQGEKEESEDHLRGGRKHPGELSKLDLLQEKQKLVSVHLKVSQSVLWFEEPRLANWDPIRGYWSTEDIHDIFYDDEEGVKGHLKVGPPNGLSISFHTPLDSLPSSVRADMCTRGRGEPSLSNKTNPCLQTITFKTGRLGLMGLHVSRYCSLPYLDWLVEAHKDGGVTFYLKTSKSELTFHIKEGKVCLEAMRDVPSKAMNWILGNYYQPLELIEHLRKGGIDVFPAPDAAFYVDDIKSKHVVIERNVYQVLGVFCKSFRFRRSKFNQEAGSGNTLFQAQEVHKNHQVDYCLIQTTMCSSFVLDITEDSDRYSPEPAPSMASCVDLYSLLYKNCTGEARRQADATCYLLVQTVKEFLSFGPKKKKLTKKERQRLADELERLRRVQAEQERLRLLKEEKERIEREKKLAQEQAKRERAEQEVREQQLAVSCGLFRNYQEQKRQLEKTIRMQNEWSRYLSCDGLPDPNSFSQMNTYLFLWAKDCTCMEMEKVLEKTEEILKLLEGIDELIYDPPHNSTSSHLSEWKKIRNDMRCLQQKRVDMATYSLLRNIEKNLSPLDMTTSSYTAECPHFTMNLWTKSILPVSVASAKEVKQSFTLEFANIGVSLLLPATVAGINMAVRALWLKYDHISDSCRTYDCPKAPEGFLKDLDSVTIGEWRTKTTLHRQQQEYEDNLDGATAEELLAALPKTSVDEAMAEAEEQQIKDWKRAMTTESDPHEVNLRKFAVLGGVFYLDLLQQPPQPRELSAKCVITLLDNPNGLHPMPYYEHYIPPPPPEPGARRTPEEIEVEVKEREKAMEKLAAVSVSEEPEKAKMPAEDLKREMEKEKELQRLVVVTIDLPETVLWFEQPMAANWDPDHRYWSTEEIHDLKFNEDKQTVTFRSGRMGLMALACYRYCNFPYQGWEMKPEMKGAEGGVILNVTAAVAIIEFLIRDGKVAVNSLQNGTTSALQEHVGVFYRPKKLIRLLQNGGVDVFPPLDAFCYVDGGKHRSAEDHLYHCMAVMSTAFNFSWSRWNMLAGRRNMVLQMRECLDRKRLPNYSIVHVSPLRAVVVRCSEVSASFSEEGVEGMKFYSDLYALATEHASKEAKTRMEEISYDLAETVHEMLCATRPLSFS